MQNWANNTSVPLRGKLCSNWIISCANLVMVLNWGILHLRVISPKLESTLPIWQHKLHNHQFKQRTETLNTSDISFVWLKSFYWSKIQRSKTEYSSTQIWKYGYNPDPRNFEKYWNTKFLSDKYTCQRPAARYISFGIEYNLIS